MHLARRPLALPAAIVLAALAIRIAVVLATPHYQLVADAIDYDKHAVSIVTQHRFAFAYGRPTAFRPPAYPLFVAAVYWIFGTGPDRIEVARLANAFVGAGIVALIGVLAHQLWDRRVALVAMALAAVYIPLIEIGQAVMSEPLFTLLALAALITALRRRAVLTGVLTGLTILGRANGAVLLLPYALAMRGWRKAGVVVVLAALVVVPWTIRNERVLHHFVPVSTQLGSALAGTYNAQAAHDRRNPASWRSLKRVPPYKRLFVGIAHRNEAEMEGTLRHGAIEYIKAHPAYVATVVFWTTRRLFELGGLDWSRHTGRTVSVDAFWSMAGVYCFWVFAVLALVGAFTRRARSVPLEVWLVPVLMYLSVAFLVVETPRYRTAIDPFVVLLAAVALTSGGWRVPRVRSALRARQRGDGHLVAWPK